MALVAVDTGADVDRQIETLQGAACCESNEPRFDKLEAWARAGDWDAVRGYKVKGINSYAKMVKQYRDRLLTAHAASTSSEAA